MKKKISSKIIYDLNHIVSIFSMKVKEKYDKDVEDVWYDLIKEEKTITNDLLLKNNIDIISKVKKTTKEKTISKIKEKNDKYKNKPVLKNIVQNVPLIQIRRNKYGNFEHEPTNLVFDRDEKIVIGKQVGENIIELSEDDIENCKKYKFSYKIPENLDKGKVTKSIKIDEYSIDDDDDYQDDIDDEEEVEEEDETEITEDF